MEPWLTELISALRKRYGQKRASQHRAQRKKPKVGSAF